jgi:hypothetical protein
MSTHALIFSHPSHHLSICTCGRVDNLPKVVVGASTLVFDTIFMVQSCAYRGQAARKHYTRVDVERGEVVQEGAVKIHVNDMIRKAKKIPGKILKRAGKKGSYVRVGVDGENDSVELEPFSRKSTGKPSRGRKQAKSADGRSRGAHTKKTRDAPPMVRENELGWDQSDELGEANLSSRWAALDSSRSASDAGSDHHDVSHLHPEDLLEASFSSFTRDGDGNNYL